jgi:hypothetical protein
MHKENAMDEMTYEMLWLKRAQAKEEALYKDAEVLDQTAIEEMVKNIIMLGGDPRFHERPCGWQVTMDDQIVFMRKHPSVRNPSQMLYWAVKKMSTPGPEHFCVKHGQWSYANAYMETQNPSGCPLCW